jgi:hypothetical protein
MPTKLLPRKAEDPKYRTPLSKVELERHDRNAEWRALRGEEIRGGVSILAGSRGERTITKEKSV